MNVLLLLFVLHMRRLGRDGGSLMVREIMKRMGKMWEGKEL